MADRDSGEDLARLVADLVSTLRDLEDELEPPDDRAIRPPTPRELRRFTSDVAIPGLILVLETNVRALRLLRRALQVSETADRTREETAELGERARDVSETTLARLDEALVELQAAVEDRPQGDEAADLLEEARDLREEVQARLRDYTDEVEDGPDGPVQIDVEGSDDTDDAAADGEDRDDDDGGDPLALDDSAAVDIDVDAELESIKRDLDGNGTDGSAEDDDGTDPEAGAEGEDTGGEDTGDADDADGTDGTTGAPSDESSEDGPDDEPSGDAHGGDRAPDG